MTFHPAISDTQALAALQADERAKRAAYEKAVHRQNTQLIKTTHRAWALSKARLVALDGRARNASA